jgi:hypothetical protein
MNDRSDNTTHENIFGTTANPCPDWCTLPAGHGYDSQDGSGMFRGHEHSTGWLREPSGDGTVSMFVAIESLEALRSTGSGVHVEVVDPPHISLDSNDGNMSSRQAREVARMLLEAAAKLDEVNQAVQL